MKLSPFFINFCVAQPCSLVYVYLYEPKIGLSSLVLIAGRKIRLLIGKQLNYCMKILYESTEFYANVYMSVLQCHHINIVAKSIYLYSSEWINT